MENKDNEDFKVAVDSVLRFFDNVIFVLAILLVVAVCCALLTA